MEVVVERQPSWLTDQVKEEFAEAAALTDGWLGAGSRGVSAAAVHSALLFLSERLPASTPPPSVVPTATGGIQLEWRTASAHMEVEFDHDGEVVDASVEDVSLNIDESSEDLWAVEQSLLLVLKALADG